MASIFFARLGVTAFDVRATKDGSVVHIGRFKSKLQAAASLPLTTPLPLPLTPTPTPTLNPNANPTPALTPCP